MKQAPPDLFAGARAPGEVPAADAAGHRARLRERLLRQGGDTLAEHELVEYLLALAIPRRDTKPLAKRLLREFGGLEKLVTADADALLAVDGVGETAAAAIKIVHATALSLVKRRVAEQPVLSSWQALIDYLHADMAHLGRERVRVLHLDNKNRLIRDETASEGTTDQAAVHVREVIASAVRLGSSSLILVHNHPSGDPKPSRQDIQLTREIADAAKPLGIQLHDHVIIGASGHASLRAMGLI